MNNYSIFQNLDMKLIIVCCLVAMTFASKSEEQEPIFCEKNGVFIEKGETYHVDACQSCLCRNGSLKCELIQCDWHDCPEGEWPITYKGDCCPTCTELLRDNLTFLNDHFLTLVTDKQTVTIWLHRFKTIVS
ncbi:collagen, type I, alpha 1 [Bulinus truncatus]|nr:collagen, type I, alpha 1 [Bulinus truncatus]